MESWLHPRCGPISPLGEWFEDDERRLIMFETRSIQRSKDKLEMNYRDWDKPGFNDQRTTEPRWECTVEEEEEWLEKMKKMDAKFPLGERTDDKNDLTAVITLTNDEVPEVEVDPDYLPRKYPPPKEFYSVDLVARQTAEALIHYESKMKDFEEIKQATKTNRKKYIRRKKACAIMNGKDAASLQFRLERAGIRKPPGVKELEPLAPRIDLVPEWNMKESAEFKKKFEERIEKLSKKDRTVSDFETSKKELKAFTERYGVEEPERIPDDPAETPAVVPPAEVVKRQKTPEQSYFDNAPMERSPSAEYDYLANYVPSPEPPERSPEFQMASSSPIRDKSNSRTPSVLREVPGDDEPEKPVAPEYKKYTAEELLGDMDEKTAVMTEDEDNAILDDSFEAGDDLVVPIEENILVETDAVVVAEEEAAAVYGLLEESDEVIEEAKKRPSSVEKSVSVEPESDPLVIPEDKNDILDEAALLDRPISMEPEAVIIPEEDAAKEYGLLEEDALLDGATFESDAQQNIDEDALLEKSVSVEPENNLLDIPDQDFGLFDAPNLIEPEFTAPDFQDEGIEKEYGQPTIREMTPAPARFRRTEVEPTGVVEPTPEPVIELNRRGRPKKRGAPPKAVGTVAKKPAPKEEAAPEESAPEEPAPKPEEPIKEKKRPAPRKRGAKAEEDPATVLAPRTKRTYLSKNNPLPRVRGQQDAAPQPIEEPDRMTGIAGECRSGSPGGTPEKLKHMSLAMRKLTEVDREESVVSQENQPMPETEIKKEEDWVIPPPINEYSRVSRKKQRIKIDQQILDEIKEENMDNRDSECRIVMENIREIKDEELDPDLFVTQATYNISDLTPLEPEVLPVKTVDPNGKANPTHVWLVTHKMWDGVNELFMTDPEKFSKLMIILSTDSERMGRSFKYSVTVENRTREFLPKFIQWLSKCKKDLTLELEEYIDYLSFSKAFREKASLHLNNHKITAASLHQIIDKIKEIRNGIREQCPAGSLGVDERAALIATERILLRSYIEAVMKMAGLSQITWTTDTHVKRRLEMIFYGWKMFLATGGFFRVLLVMERQDVKPIGDVLRKYCENYVAEIDILYKRAVDMYNKSDQDVLKEMAPTLTAEEIVLLDADIQAKKSDTHTIRCTACLVRQADALFSTQKLHQIHQKIHKSEIKECGRCYYDFLLPELFMHQINKHNSMRDHDAF